MGWLRLVGSLEVSFAKETYKKEDILQKRSIILRSLLIAATPYHDTREIFWQYACTCSWTSSCLIGLCANEPYKREDILQKRPIILRSLLIAATPCHDTREIFSSLLRGFHVMGWLQSVGSIKLYVSFAEYSLFYRALLLKRPIIWSILTEATPDPWNLNCFVCTVKISNFSSRISHAE